jgi:protein phosphatase
MDVSGISDRGKVREKNEDCFTIYRSGPFQLFAVADGMGGHAAGEVASTLALEAVQEYLENKNEQMLSAVAANQVPSMLQNMLSFANDKVLAASRADVLQAGMGTTLTMLLGANSQYWIGHIGDSRAYLINRSGIVHLTEDHTLVTQLVQTGQLSESQTNDHPQRHILTRALGTDEEAVFDVVPHNFQEGDALLICSDGLYSLVENREICDLVIAGNDAYTVLNELVHRANERGGLDNITAILIYF